MKTRLLILLTLVVATAAGADNSPVIWKGSNAKDLSSGGLETNKLVLPKAAGSSVKVTLQPSGSTSSSFALTLPVDDGAANECLKTDGSGALAWTKIADANVASGAAIDATKIGGGGVTTTEFGYIGGLTSDAQTQLDGKQPLDSDLTAVAGLSSTGIVARTGSGTAAVRTITANSSKVAITNGDGVSGNPTVDVTEANLTLDNIGGTLGLAKGGTNATSLSAGAAYSTGSALATEAQLDRTRGGTGVSSTATFPATSTSTTSSFALVAAANTFTAAQTVAITDAGTTSTPSGLVVEHQSSDTPAAGFGVTLDFIGESSTTTGRTLGNIIASWTDATDASRTSKLEFRTNNSGTAATRVTIAGNGGVTIAETTGGTGNVPHNCTRRTASATNGGGSVTVCNSGEVAVGGGCSSGAGASGLYSSYPPGTNSNRDWRCEWGASNTWTAHVYCCTY